MKRMRLPKFLSFLLSFSLLISPLPLSAIVESIENNIHSDEQKDEISYIYLERDRSDLADIIMK